MRVFVAAFRLHIQGLGRTDKKRNEVLVMHAVSLPYDGSTRESALRGVHAILTQVFKKADEQDNAAPNEMLARLDFEKDLQASLETRRDGIGGMARAIVVCHVVENGQRKRICPSVILRALHGTERVGEFVSWVLENALKRREELVWEFGYDVPVVLTVPRRLFPGAGMKRQVERALSTVGQRPVWLDVVAR